MQSYSLRASAVCFLALFFCGGREAQFPGRVLDGKTARIKKAACGRCGAPPDHQKSIRFFTINDMVDSPCTNPYKTRRLRSLLEPFLQNGPKKYQKSIRFPVKVDDILGLCKMSKKHWSQSISEHSGKLIKIPYKTCRLWRLLRSISQNGSKKHQKKHQEFH